MHPIRRFAEWSIVLTLTVAPVYAQSSREPVAEGRSSLGPGGRAAWLERVEAARARYEAFATKARLALHPRIVEPGLPPARTSILDDP
ncbi:MAG: hypothetical protein JO004_07180, partial [Methylobacteriaceae bacterium]|nr:hypothetical protein [Methylobacteriaceae bacterium]